MRIKVTDNKEHAEKIRKLIRDNNGYCPCRLVRNDDTKCICKEFLEQEEGECHCGLYIKLKDD